MSSIALYDTTLRDGTQREGISLSVEDKLKITRLLDELGIHFVEGGWPGSNPKDEEYFERVKRLGLRQATICAFSYTGRADVPVEQDPNLAKLLSAGTAVVTIVGKSWLLHVNEVLRVTPRENLRMIEETVRFLQSQGRRVFYDAEHFFDGYKDDAAYAVETLRAAVRGGAEAVILCDTNGGSLPWEVEAITRSVVEALRGAGAESGGVQGGVDVGGSQTRPDRAPSVGIHTHNDGELGVANALAAVRAGATQVQGTINGYGERVGNCNLISTMAGLKLKMGLDVVSDEALRRLTEVAHIVAELCNLPPDTHQPYVGLSAFAHKGGIHADATVKSRHSYQHVDPALVGNQTRVLVSELSGKGNLLYKVDELGLEQALGKEQARGVVAEIKTLEARGFSFESAEASVAMLIRRQQPGYRPLFELVDFTTVVEHRQGRGLLAEATVKVRVAGELAHTAADGNGPVNALDAALRKALLPHYPQLAEFELTDYKVRILDGNTGTAAIVRVLIETRHTGSAHERAQTWTTVGCSPNIIEASWQALADAVEYGLTVVGAKGQGVQIAAD